MLTLHARKHVVHDVTQDHGIRPKAQASCHPRMFSLRGGCVPPRENTISIAKQPSARRAQDIESADDSLYTPGASQ